MFRAALFIFAYLIVTLVKQFKVIIPGRNLIPKSKDLLFLNCVF